MNILTPKGLLTVGGIILVVVGVLGFFLIGPTAERSIFGAAWWFDNAENWARVVLGIVALPIAYDLKDAATQKWVTTIVGLVALLVGICASSIPSSSGRVSRILLIISSTSSLACGGSTRAWQSQRGVPWEHRPKRKQRVPRGTALCAGPWGHFRSVAILPSGSHTNHADTVSASGCCVHGGPPCRGYSNSIVHWSHDLLWPRRAAGGALRGRVHGRSRSGRVGEPRSRGSTAPSRSLCTIGRNHFGRLRPRRPLD